MRSRVQGPVAYRGPLCWGGSAPGQTKRARGRERAAEEASHPSASARLRRPFFASWAYLFFLWEDSLFVSQRLFLVLKLHSNYSSEHPFHPPSINQKQNKAPWTVFWLLSERQKILVTWLCMRTQKSRGYKGGNAIHTRLQRCKTLLKWWNASQKEVNFQWAAPFNKFSEATPTNVKLMPSTQVQSPLTLVLRKISHTYYPDRHCL